MNEVVGSRTGAVAAAIGFNLIPLIGVLVFGWHSFDVLLLYWLENVVIGVLTVLAMLRAGGAGSVFLAAFFVVHYGAFCFGHGSLLVSLLAPEGSDTSLGLVLSHTLQIGLMQLALLALAVMQGFEMFVANKGGSTRGLTTQQLMSAPYKRIVLLHVTLIGSGMLLEALDDPLVGLLLLVVLKIGFDLYQLRPKQTHSNSPL